MISVSKVERLRMGKRAVLVGINKYRGYLRHDGRVYPLDRHPLTGCVNDVRSIQSLLLSKYGFDGRDIRLLTDEHAKRRDILDALQDLAETAQPGDKLLFYFAGHGSVYRAKSTTGATKGEGRCFEILCPYDMNWDEEWFISDADLKKVVAQLPDHGSLEMGLDTCCAGRMEDVARLSRQSDPAREASTPPRGSQSHRFLVPPPDIVARLVEDRDRLTTAEIMTFLGYHGARRCVVWAACNEHQTSDEYTSRSGESHGAFTYFLTETLMADHEAKRAVVLGKIKQQLERERFQQTPELYPHSDSIWDKSFLSLS